MTTHVGDPIELSLMDNEVSSCPWDFYRQLHERCPVYQMPENGIWLITGFDDVKAALGDPATFSSRSSSMRGLHAERAALRQRMLEERGWALTPTLHRADPPLHTRHRQLLNRVFTARRVRSLAPHIEAVVHDLIDSFADRGECEFFSEFAIPLPGTIIAEQLGLPRDEVPRFKRWGDAMLSPASRVLTEDELVAAVELELECQHYLAGVFEDRRTNPRDDIMSALVHVHEEGDEAPLTMHELQDLMYQLITGGFETITSGLAHSMWLAVRHPDQVDAVRADPTLLKGFIEEALRIESPVQGQNRVTTRDVEIGGVTIPAGAIVTLRYGAANHDPAQFESPERFDVRRPNAANHLAFGGGAHFCIGAALARQEMVLAFTALLDRLEGFTLARPLPSPVHLPSLFYLHMRELPIRFTKRGL